MNVLLQMFSYTSIKQWRYVTFTIYEDRNKALRLAVKDHGMNYRKPLCRGAQTIVHTGMELSFYFRRFGPKKKSF